MQIAKCYILVVTEYCEDGDIQVELNASGLPIGRVLICQNENWGTLCVDGWSDDDASVVCARLGHPRKGQDR